MKVGDLVQCSNPARVTRAKKRPRGILVKEDTHNNGSTNKMFTVAWLDPFYKRVGIQRRVWDYDLRLISEN